jgi:hypothetical protein
MSWVVDIYAIRIQHLWLKIRPFQVRAFGLQNRLMFSYEFDIYFTAVTTFLATIKPHKCRFEYHISITTAYRTTKAFSQALLNARQTEGVGAIF